MQSKNIVFLFLIILFFLLLFYILNYSVLILKNSKTIIEKSNIDCSRVKVRLVTFNGKVYKKLDDHFLVLLENIGDKNIHNVTLILDLRDSFSQKVSSKNLSIGKTIKPGDIVSLVISKNVIDKLVKGLIDNEEESNSYNRKHFLQEGDNNISNINTLGNNSSEEESVGKVLLVTVMPENCLDSSISFTINI